MKYVIGIDQGASKTVALVIDQEGNVLGMGKSFGACHSSEGLDYAMRSVEECVSQSLKQSGLSIESVAVIAAGMTGVDWDYEEELLKKALKQRFAVNEITVVNDCIIAMHAGTTKDNACVLCAGSGLNCAIKKNKELKQVYGFYIDDEFQGGYSLGIKAIKAVLNAHIGLYPDTKLREMILEYFRIESIDALLYKKVTGEITSKDYLKLPLLVEEAAAANDAVALKLLADFGRDISMFAIQGLKRYEMINMDVDVVLSGSIFKCKVPVLKEAVSLEIHKNTLKANIVDAEYEPVVGAALLGLETLNKGFKTNVYNNLKRYADKFQLKRL